MHRSWKVVLHIVVEAVTINVREREKKQSQSIRISSGLPRVHMRRPEGEFVESHKAAWSLATTICAASRDGVF